jgi:putative transposase
MEAYKRGSHWGQYLWGSGYWVASSGVTDEVWNEYQSHRKPG